MTKKRINKRDIKIKQCEKKKNKGFIICVTDLVVVDKLIEKASTCKYTCTDDNHYRCIIIIVL